MRNKLLATAMLAALATAMTTGGMAFDHGGDSHGGFRRGFHVHGGHHGWSAPRFVGNRAGRDYRPSSGGTYYEGVAPFGRLVGPVTGGSTFFVGL